MKKMEEKVSDLERMYLARANVYDKQNGRYLRDLYAVGTNGRMTFADKLGYVYFRLERHQISIEETRLYANDDYLYCEYLDKWRCNFIREYAPKGHVKVLGYMTMDELVDGNIKFTLLVKGPDDL
jgi:hypothetical protein